MFSFNTKLSILKAIVTKRSPYYIQFYINGRCNLKCKQCNIVETNSGISELDLDDYEKVALNIRKIGGGIVLLTGGEPFLKRDLDKIVAIFKKQKIDIRLQTAGYASKEQIEKCYDAGCRDLNISLDSLDSNKQDYINSVPGTWEKAIHAIANVSNVFKDSSAICSLGCVLSRMNYREIPSILEFCTNIGWYLSLVPVHIAKKNEKYGFRSFDDDFSFQNNDFEALQLVIKKLIAMKRQGYLLFDSEKYLESSYEFLKGVPPIWRDSNNGICDSPSLYFAIRPNGDFTTCCEYTLKDTYSLTDPDFYLYYRNGLVHKKAAPIVNSCSGCHYGSYPEVTLSVRDKKALYERIKLVLLRKRKFIKEDNPENYFQIIDDIKNKNKDIYENEVWLKEELREKLLLWQDKETRKILIEKDNQKRKEEGRIRKRREQYFNVVQT
jgi:MoaA/NifB/PqqE/SkfB family radical SAM enzyme